MSTKGLKCWTGNLDGMRTGLVVARNQKEAAAIAGTSFYGFKQFWGQRSVWPAGNFKPRTLYTKPIDVRETDAIWVEGICGVER